jgi:hypothetical protein
MVKYLAPVEVETNILSLILPHYKYTYSQKPAILQKCLPRLSWPLPISASFAPLQFSPHPVAWTRALPLNPPCAAMLNHPNMIPGLGYLAQTHAWRRANKPPNRRLLAIFQKSGID